SPLCLVFTHTRRIGYGRFAIDLARAVERRGVTVHDWTEGWQVPAADKVANPGRAETVVWCQPPTHVKGWLKGQRPIVWTMWEATELPEAFRKNLHEFEMVLVPSPQNVELFSQWHDNVQLVPLGVDTDQWHYTPRPPRDVFFTFMTGGSGKRKGADVVWE